MREKDTRYTVLRLNFASEEGWAVIGLPSGAIAADSCGRLLMRLTRQQAECFAAAQAHSLVSNAPGIAKGIQALAVLAFGLCFAFEAFAS